MPRSSSRSQSRGGYSGVPVFAVDDTLDALGALATPVARAWGGPVVIVAGSNGKTTTKEMLRAALGRAMTCTRPPETSTTGSACRSRSRIPPLRDRGDRGGHEPAR